MLLKYIENFDWLSKKSHEQASCDQTNWHNWIDSENNSELFAIML